MTNLNWNLWKIKERDGVSRSKVRAETDREQCAGQRTKSVAVDLLRMICVGPIGRSSEYIRRHITSVSRLNIGSQKTGKMKRKEEMVRL